MGGGSLRLLKCLKVGAGEHSSIPGKKVRRDVGRPWGRMSRRLKEEVGQVWIPMVHDALVQGGRAIIFRVPGCARVAMHSPGQR